MRGIEIIVPAARAPRAWSGGLVAVSVALVTAGKMVDSAKVLDYCGFTGRVSEQGRMEADMLNMGGDLGASLFKTWTEEQKRAEIGRLVEGYRAGVPVGILCKMAETIAGSREVARTYLVEFMDTEERTRAVEKESGGMRQLVAEFLL